MPENRTFANGQSSRHFASLNNDTNDTMNRKWSKPITALLESLPQSSGIYKPNKKGTKKLLMCMCACVCDFFGMVS